MQLLLGAEAPHTGPTWSPSHLTLVRASFGASGATYSELSQVDLAPALAEPSADGGD